MSITYVNGITKSNSASGQSNQPENGGNWPSTTGKPSGGNRGNGPKGK